MDIKEPLKDLRTLHKRVRDNLKPIIQIAETDPSLDKLPELKVMLDKTLSMHLTSAEGTELLSKLRSQVSEILEKSGSVFGEIESKFIHSIRESGLSLKELDNGWRIETLEIKVKKEQRRIAMLYNHVVVTDWTSITSPEELQKVFDDSRNRVEALLLERKIRDNMFRDAFDYLAWRRERDKTANPQMVPIKEFYQECAVNRFRQSFTSKRVEEPFSMLAFLRNLDEYVKDLASIEPEQRLSFHTAAQAEQSKGIGVTTGGLNPKSDYKTLCYVSAKRTS